MTEKRRFRERLAEHPRARPLEYAIKAFAVVAFLVSEGVLLSFFADRGGYFRGGLMTSDGMILALPFVLLIVLWRTARGVTRPDIYFPIKTYWSIVLGLAVLVVGALLIFGKALSDPMTQSKLVALGLVVAISAPFAVALRDSFRERPRLRRRRRAG